MRKVYYSNYCSNLPNPYAKACLLLIKPRYRVVLNMVSGQVQLGVEELAGASEGDEPIHRHREQKKVDDDEAQDYPGERLNEERVDRAHEVRVDGQVDQGKADLGKHDGPQ